MRRKVKLGGRLTCPCFLSRKNTTNSQPRLRYDRSAEFLALGDSVPRGSAEARCGRMDAGKCFVVDKGDPFRRARKIQRRRREIPETHYQA